MKCLMGYMAMSSVLLLGLMGGVMWKSVLEAFQIPCDAFTFYGFLWNFAVVGVVAIFYQKVGEGLALKHGKRPLALGSVGKLNLAYSYDEIRLPVLRREKSKFGPK